MRAFVDLSVHWARWEYFMDRPDCASTRTTTQNVTLECVRVRSGHAKSCVRFLQTVESCCRAPFFIHCNPVAFDRYARQFGQRNRIYEGPPSCRARATSRRADHRKQQAPVVSYPSVGRRSHPTTAVRDRTPDDRINNNALLEAIASLGTEHPDGFEIGAVRWPHEAIPATQRTRARSGDACGFCFRAHWRWLRSLDSLRGHLSEPEPR